MDSGKLRQSEWLEHDLQPISHIELIYPRCRALSVADTYADLIAVCVANADEIVPPVHTRSKRWHSDDAFEMRRITSLKNKAGELIGFRPMIQQGHGSSGRKVHASFRASDFDGNISVALAQAKAWRDETEVRLGIKPGCLRSKSVERPFAGVSLIVSNNPGARSYWGSDAVAGKKTIRRYIGQKSYAEAYREVILLVAERDKIPIPADLPEPPPPRPDQYKRMIKARFTDIPSPEKRRKGRSQ